MKLSITSAKKDQITAIYRLIRSESKYLLYRNRKDISTHLGNFIVACDGDAIIGCGSFENYSPEIAEVRSLVVLPHYRGKNIGKKLLRVLLKRKGKHQKVFIVTSKVSYFERLGFHNCLNEKYVLFKR